MVRVTLIFKDRVAKEIALLDAAEAMPQNAQRAIAISLAKKQIRAIASMTDMGVSNVKCVTEQVVDIFRKYFRDVGEDTFVLDVDSVLNFISACTKKDWEA